MNRETILNDNKEEEEIPNKWRIFTHCSKLFQFQIVLKNHGSVARDHVRKFHGGAVKVWHQSLFLYSMFLFLLCSIHLLLLYICLLYVNNNTNI